MFLLVLMITDFLMAQGSKETKKIPCKYWQAKVDKKLKLITDIEVDESDEEVILDAIECLLKMRGNKNPARFSGATHLAVSSILPPATADVAALYYISYLYYQKWNHGNGVAILELESGRLNRPEAIERAFDSYERWFGEVKRIGLAKARQMKLDPLKNSGLVWF